MAPAGDVYQAGTLSGNPLAMAAGRAQLATLAEHPDAYGRLETLAARLAGALQHAAEAAGVPLAVARIGSALTPFFRSSTPTNYAEAREADTAAFARFHGAMLDQGVLLPPSQFECWFVSLAHDEALVDRTIEAAGQALKAVAAR
jgi:glutamate-1-semialdehyde 2,1-aminomutase